MTGLDEAKYEDIFSPETLKHFKGKSKENLESMLGDKNLMDAMMRSQELLNELIQIEAPHKDSLIKIAVDIVEETYPIVGYNNIRIEAILGDGGDVSVNNVNAEEEEEEEEEEGGIETPEEEGSTDQDKKRRLINAITQGASVKGAFTFLMFRDHLDEIHPEIVDKYNEILKLAFGIYNDDNALAMMLAALGQGLKVQGGESAMEYDEEEEQFVIKAKGLIFPMLVHEIIKGLYEIINTEMFGPDREANQALINRVDKIENEPEDLQKGPIIFDGLRELFLTTNYNDDDRVRELFFAEVASLSYKNLNTLISKITSGEINDNITNWAQTKVNEILEDLNKDDIDDIDGIDTTGDDEIPIG